MERPARGGDRRSPGGEKRTYMLSVRLSGSERDAARAAAERAGMAVSAWVGELVIDAAEHRALPVGWLHREVVRELIQLREQFTMAAGDVRQIVRAPNSGAAPGHDRHPVVDRLMDIAARVERATETVRRRM